MSTTNSDTNPDSDVAPSADEPTLSLEDRLETAFAEAYGRGMVCREHTHRTGRRTDLLVDAGAVTLAVDVEERPGKVVEASGRAIHAAAHDPNGWTIPVVVVPDGNTPDEPERCYLGESIAVFEESELRERLPNVVADPGHVTPDEDDDDEE